MATLRMSGIGRRRKERPQLSPDREDDNAIVLAGLLYALLAALAWIAEHDLGLRAPWLVAAISGAFALHLLLIRRILNDPVVIFAIVMFMYSFLPAIAVTADPGSTLGFDLSVAYDLFNTGQIATMLGVSVACGFLRATGPAPTVSALDSTACLFGGVVAGVLAIGLISLAIASRGFVLGGEASYAESFTQQTEAGNGLYMLCIPLCLASVGLILASRHRLAGYLLLIPVLCFIEIAIGIGQRKYFLQPALFIFAFYWTSRKLWQTLLAVALAVLGFLVFCYLGFLRLNALGIEAVLNPADWANFFSEIGVYVGSETVYLYATAASAVTRFVTPLDYGADYLMAWSLSVPRFLLTDGMAALYTSANDRFSFSYNALQASLGQGYGFSFLGEAYLVGGLPGAFIVVIVEICCFRFLYLRGGGSRPAGVWGAISLISLYFAMWTQRNALGFIFKEFVVHAVGATVCMFYAGRVVSRVVLSTVAKVHRDSRQEAEGFQSLLPSGAELPATQPFQSKVRG